MTMPNFIGIGAPPETRRPLTGPYRADITELQERLGRDLSHWLA